MTFMQFWKTANKILKARMQEPMQYGEAHGHWTDHINEDSMERASLIRQQIRDASWHAPVANLTEQ